MNLKDAILSATKKRERFDVPEFGVPVYLRELTYAEMKLVRGEGEEPAFKLLALSLCDEAGATILTVEELQTVSNSIIQKLLTAALEVNKMGAAVEESKKN